MFSRLFRKSAPEASPTHALAAGKRVYAIGDIHGRRDLFDDLLDRIDADDAERGPADTELILLGDLVDRGDDSRGVVERAMAIEAAGRPIRFLSGNHEEVFTMAYRGDRGAAALLARIGGRETALSYGITEAEFDRGEFADLIALLVDRVPLAHIEFLEGFRSTIAIDDYLFVHAGIRPGIPLAEQRESDLRWIRQPFLDHAGSHGQMVVHGHTVTDDVVERPNRIGIDTGAFASGRLTALGLEGSERWFLRT